MKLSVVFPVHNQHALSEAVIDLARANLSGDNEVEFIIIDNASKEPFHYFGAALEKGSLETKVVRYTKNVGVYPIFWEALKHCTGDVVAVFHSDLFVAEAGWDTRVLEAFESHPKLGLLGFIGSNEIDGSGGRGLGTSSNFLGGRYEHKMMDGQRASWQGSPAEVHGRRETGYMNAAVVDGCAMIFRRSVLESISQRENFPPHHFYDRLLSSEVLEKGFEVGVLGIGFDHISGQTVNQEDSYHIMAAEWWKEHAAFTIDREVVQHSEGQVNWDATLYREAERQWLGEYRDTKHLVPTIV